MSEPLEVFDKASWLLAEHGADAPAVALAAYRFCDSHGVRRAADLWLEVLRALEAMRDYPSARVH